MFIYGFIIIRRERDERIIFFLFDFVSSGFQHDSGLLVTLLFLRTKESSKASNDVTLASGTKQSVLLFIYRYIRLTPVYFVVLIADILLLK